MRDVFDAFDAPARLTLVERFAEALETSHASSEPASRRTDSRSSFVRLEARLRTSAKRCEAHLARGARRRARLAHRRPPRAVDRGGRAGVQVHHGRLPGARRAQPRGASPRVARRARRDAARVGRVATPPSRGKRTRRNARRLGRRKRKRKRKRRGRRRRAAAGACLWLEARASSARARLPARRTRRIHVMFVGRVPPNTRARARGDGRGRAGRGRTSTRTVDAAIVDDTVDASALLARRLATAAAAAEFTRESPRPFLCDRTLTTHTVSSEPHLPSVFAAAAPRARSDARAGRGARPPPPRDANGERRRR